MYQRNPRTVVITGASAGVGRATAVAFAGKGWNVGLIARGKEGLEGARRDVEPVIPHTSSPRFNSGFLVSC